MNVTAVVVFFRPPVDAVDTVTALATAGVKCVVVINEASQEVTRLISDIRNISVVRNDHNIGLATALNQGIKVAMNDPVTEAVLLLDQDSKPTLEMLRSLYRALQELKQSGKNPACVGPKLVDIKSPTAKVMAGDANERFVAVESLATSGTLIPRDALEKVGPMMDQLFIDCIDHEWCLRAQSYGLKVYMVNDAVMMHDMGDGAIKVMGRFKPLHRSPVRHYYIIRNNLFMMRLAHIPLKWKIKEFFKTVRRAVAYMVISNDKLKTSRLICDAIVDGCKDELHKQKVLRARG